MKQSLQLRIGHQLTMTPQLQQAIRLLQLSAVDLQTEIQNVLETNSMLELDDKEPEWQNPLKKIHKSSNKQSGNEIDTLNPMPTSLRDYLIWQMQLTPFSDNDRLIAATLIDAINDDGFLTSSINDVITTIKQEIEIDIDQSEVEAVLHRIQQFDPLGVGARDLKECLKIQLDHLPTQSLLPKALLMLNYLELLAKHDFATLKRRINVNMDELQQVIRIIQALNPRPGTEIGLRAPEYVIPDLYAFKDQEKWQVELNPECTPHLQINSQYAKLVRRQNSSQDEHFLKSQLQEAKWFLKSIENRNDTLLSVARCVVGEQQNFLEHGEEAMKPLILQDVATKLNLHESTISRITTQKYIATPRGTFELKYFFSGGEVSCTAIRALIKKIIAKEDRKKPFSDNTLAKLLLKEGIHVARRTVAKYREELAIPPSNERKSLP